MAGMQTTTAAAALRRAMLGTTSKLTAVVLAVKRFAPSTRLLVIADVVTMGFIKPSELIDARSSW